MGAGPTGGIVQAGSSANGKDVKDVEIHSIEMKKFYRDEKFVQLHFYVGRGFIKLKEVV